VVDDLGVPAAGVTVAPSFGTVRYLSPDLTSTDGLTATTSSGAFLSTDAPFQGGAGALNFWSATNGTVSSTGTVIGGIVQNKVTIVILRLAAPAT
jgi:hypothetical protein